MSQPALSLDSRKQALRFLLAGGLNTAVGFAVIWALLAAGVSDIPANIGGYAAGLSLSFFVNRIWTFERTGRPTGPEITLFGMAFFVAYCANMTIILAGQSMGVTGNPLVHLTGVVVYTAVFFFLNKAVVYAPKNKTAFASGLNKFREHWPEYAVILSLIAIACYVLTLQLTHDVSWQFWIARQILAGVPLYTHIMEINPPLWFWMALPIQQLATMLNVAPDRIYIVAIFILTAWSTLATGRLLFAVDRPRRCVFMLSIVLLCLLAPIYDFGQREQIAVILALPYGALLFKRVSGEPVSAGFALAIGLSAAFGFALKHYFALVPIALELWLLWRGRRLAHSVRVETMALGLSAVGYVASIAIFTPDFFRLIVPMVESAYHGYEKPLIVQALRIEVLIWAIAALSYPSLRRGLDARDQLIGDMLAICTFAFAASYFLQQKGWQYHAIPATVFASLLMINCFVPRRDLVGSLAKHPAAFLAAILFVSIGTGRGHYESDWAKPMSRVLANEQPGTSVMMLTVDPRRVFPFMDDYQLIWPSRHFAHWMISGIAHAEMKYRGVRMTPELDKLSDVIRRQAVEDMKCHPPSLVLSQIRNRGAVLNPERFRMTDFFRRNQEFRSYLAANYRLEWTDRTFEAYRRVTPLVAEGTHCYRVSANIRKE